MKKILNENETYIHFECPKCQKNRDICTIPEAIYNGAPMCVDCQEEMDILECYVEGIDEIKNRLCDK